MEDIDPQVGGGFVLAATTEVRAEHLDEEHPAIPPEVLETLEETDLSGVKSSDHPDNWSEERWYEESLKGKAKGCTFQCPSKTRRARSTSLHVGKKCPSSRTDNGLSGLDLWHVNSDGKILEEMIRQHKQNLRCAFGQGARVYCCHR